MGMRVKRTDGPHRIMIAYTSESPLWHELADTFLRLGFRVDLISSSNVGVSNTLVEMGRTLSDIDYVIFPFSEEDLAHAQIEIVKERVAHQVGLIKSILGLNGVAILIEDSFGQIFHESVISEFSYNKYSVGLSALRIASAIEDEVGPRIARQYLQKPVNKQLQEFEVKMGVLLIFPVLFLAVIFMVGIILNLLRSDQSVSVAANEELLEPRVGAIESDREFFSQDSGGFLFPVTCEILTTANVELAQSITCSEFGNINLKGNAGPWHNSIRYMKLDSGVSVRVLYEDGSSDTFPDQSINSGIFRLDEKSASFGVDRLDIFFTSSDQKIFIYNSESKFLELVYSV